MFAKNVQVMAATKFYLDKRASRKGSPSPLKLSITKDRKVAFVSLNIKLMPDEWDAVKQRVINHPQRVMLNNYLSRRMLKVNELLMSLAENGRLGYMTAFDIKRMITNEAQRDAANEQGVDNFLCQLGKYASRAKKPRTRDLYLATARVVERFDPRAKHLCFEDIDDAWLHDLDKFMERTSPKRNARNIHFRNIRAVFNWAIDNEITSKYPFRRFKIRAEQTSHRDYSAVEIRSLLAVPEDSPLRKYADMFLLMFMLIGINCADLFEATDIDGGRLNYIRAKTYRAYSIKIEPEAMAIINKYKGRRKLISFAENHSTAKTLLIFLNKGLQKIEGFKHATTYVARHSWASIAASLDIPKDTIAAALGHGGNTVTDIYINFDRRKVDEANRKVIDYIFCKEK